jgi:hypothetical protein
MKAMTKCAICKKTGGRFRFRPGKGDWVHVGSCVAVSTPRDGTHKNWPLVTTHLAGPNDGPMVIQNLQQLRRLENTYGASSEAYSMDRGNREE